MGQKHLAFIINKEVSINPLETSQEIGKLCWAMSFRSGKCGSFD